MFYRDGADKTSSISCGFFALWRGFNLGWETIAERTKCNTPTYSSFDLSKPSLYFFILFCFSVSVEISLAKSFISVVFWSIVDNTNFYQGERWISDHQLLRKMYESLWNIPTVWIHETFGPITGKTSILDTQSYKIPCQAHKKVANL